MPSPASESKPVRQYDDGAPKSHTSVERQQRLLEATETFSTSGPRKTPESSTTIPSEERRPASEVRQPPQEETATAPGTHGMADTITRVPDEHLPSHRDRQRWSLSKRFSEFMDEVLPKLAVVTQKVNTYTGTDYSGVEALRREIIEQEQLVKSRRLAIDSAKQALDTAHAQQASSQKEVVALLERKHSWSAGDLERYMALIRSEHINDRDVREAKDAIVNAEKALEEARGQLEKRERAQYHEEQIWSDTIRRNSTWVTFGLMGVNIFLLLLSLAILEPWRRRRMVREIKNALAAQKVAMETAPASVAAVVPAVATQDLTSIEEEIDRTTELEETILESNTPASTASAIEETQIAGMPEPMPAPRVVTERVTGPVSECAVPGTALLPSEDAQVTPHESIDLLEETAGSSSLRQRIWTWRRQATAAVQDVVSKRVISMRRVDYTTAILQGAAAGAVIAAAIVAMLRPN